MHNIEVSGCLDCPFLVDGYSMHDPATCYFTGEELKAGIVILPRCPLLEREVVVKIKPREKE